jgi:enoyl-CoA hydratase/carnithine racemase
VGIVPGSGERFFSAGWDLKAATANAVDRDWGAGGFAALTELFDIGKPVIAAVNGLAVGGGLGLVLACDLIVAASHAEFFLPEATIGLIAGGVLRLPQRLPYAVAMEMFLTGRRMGTEEAQGLAKLDDAFEARIRAAQKGGELRRKDDPAVLAMLASATLHTIAIRARAGTARAELEKLARKAVAAICGQEP